MEVPFSSWLRQTIYLAISNLLVSPNMMELVFNENGKVAQIKKVQHLSREAKKVVSMGILKLTVIKASNLPRTDLTGLSDPYVTVAIDGSLYFQKTSIKKVDLNPVWNEHFFFPIMDPLNQVVSISLTDHNSLVPDEIIENFEVPILDSH